MRTLAIASMSAGLVLAGAAFAQVPSEGMFLSAADLKATVGKPVGGLAKTNLPTGPGVTIIAAYRDADGFFWFAGQPRPSRKVSLRYSQIGSASHTLMS